MNSKISMNFLSEILKNVSEHPHVSAIHYNGAPISYVDFFRTTFHYMHCLSSLKKNSKPCIVLSDRSPVFLQAMFAILLAKLIYVPMNLEAPFYRNKAIISEVKSPVVFVGSISVELCKRYLTLLTDAIVIFSDFVLFSTMKSQLSNHQFFFVGMPNDKSEIPAVKFELDKMAYLFFTSGSTGRPKGVPITYRSLSAYLNDVTNLFRFDRQGRFLQICDLSFDLSLHEILLCFMHVGTLYLYSDDQFPCLARYLYQHKIEYTIMVPSVIPMVIKQGKQIRRQLYCLKFAFFCGEVLPLPYAGQFQVLAPNAKIINLYGPTEATIACSYHRYESSIDYGDLLAVPIGYPFPSTQFAVSNSGELRIKGDQVFTGYWKSIENFKPEFYDTGDVVYLHEQLGYCYQSRVDHQWQIRGIRLEKNDIELTLRRLLNIDSLYLAPIYREGLIIQLCLFSNIELNLAAHEKILKDELPLCIFPLLAMRLAEIPRLPNQKIDYRALEKLAQDYVGERTCEA